MASHLQDGGHSSSPTATVCRTLTLPPRGISRTHGKAATVTAVAPPGRYGALEIADGIVSGSPKATRRQCADKRRLVLNPSVVDRIEGDHTAFENEPLEGLARDHQLVAFRHDGFWADMDTLRDKNHLEALWTAGTAPWRR